MASTSLKIYNDTVLKQSTLQGYQVQRTNDNLGRFTMGELAFTRDTGRLFIGNYTNNTTTLDSNYVSGGILTGNKYLGFVDSKPLIHFSASGTTGWKPLSYEVDTFDEVTNQTEPAIFGVGSRFRKEDANGWNKKSQFIEKYGVYSGDYTFDIYNNALILFDSNITTNPVTQPKRKITEADDGKFKEIIVDQSGNDVTETQKRRTPIYENVEERNADYPIYGDGYVIMRILEPDGVTLGYQDRTFVFNNGGVNDDGSPEKENWSHNIITLKKVPAYTLLDTFDESQFLNTARTGGDIIKLQPQLPGIEAILGDELALPSNLTLNSDDKSVHLEFSFHNPISEHIYSNPYTDYILSITPTKYKDETNKDQTKYNVTVAKQYIPEYKIMLHDGLINTATGKDFLLINQQNSDTKLLHLGYKPDENDSSSSIGYTDPLNVGFNSNFIYAGTNTFTSNGLLNSSENYDEQYLNEAKNKINKFDTDGNVAYNLLKKPMPICWSYPTSGESGTSHAKLDFIINPFIHCIKKSYTKGTVGEIERDYTINSPQYNTDIIVLGNNDYESGIRPSTIPVIDGFSYPITNDDFYTKKVVNSTTSTIILSSTNIDVNDTETEDEILFQSGRIKYYSFQDVWYPIFIDNYNKKVFKDNNGIWRYTQTDEELSPQPLEGEEPTDNFYENCTILSQTTSTSTPSTPSSLTRDWFDVSTEENPSSDISGNPIIGNIIPKKDYTNVISLIKTKLTDEKNETYYKFQFHDSDNQFDDFDNFFEYSYIEKIEISTNSKDKRWETLFDESVALTYNDYDIYNPDTNTILVKRYDESIFADVYECVYNSPLFLTNTFAPYVLKIQYSTHAGETKTRLVSLEGDISYSNIVPLEKIESNQLDDDDRPIFKYYIAEDTLTSVLIDNTTVTPEYFYLNHFDANTSSLINLNDINSIIFVTENNTDVQISPYNPIYTHEPKNEEDLSYYTWYETFDTVTDGKLTVKFRGTGVASLSKVDDENFIIESVTGNTTKTIKELLDNRLISIPTAIIVPYKSTSHLYYQVKTVPSHPNGYSIASSVIDENKVTIPQTASSLVVQVHHYTENNSDVTLYSAATIEDLGTVKTITNEDLTTQEVSTDAPYTFPFSLTLPENGVPTLIENASMNDKEKILYHSNTSDVQVIDIPLYKTTIDQSKGFSLRVANMPCGGNQDKFLIRVIGYRV